mgnify:CR=1 FL=1
MQPEVEALLRANIRLIEDWPKPGVKFQDLTGLMSDGAAFSTVIAEINRELGGQDFHQVVGIEARGFPYGAALAASRGAGFTTARKPGKLPPEVLSLEYELEYGSGCRTVAADIFVVGEAWGKKAHNLAVEAYLLDQGSEIVKVQYDLRTSSTQIKQTVMVQPARKLAVAV